QSTRSIDGTPYTMQTGYDAGGRLLWTTYPDGDTVGTSVSPLVYDGAGRLKTIPGIVTSATYDAMRRVLTQNDANGAVTNYAFDSQRAWMSSISTTSGASTIQNTTYTRAADGDVTQVSSSFADESWTYAYDDRNRLTSATDTTTNQTQTLVYDATGNVTSNS